MRSPPLTVACVALLYVALAFLVFPQDAFFSSDEGLKFIQVQNFVRKGWKDFTLDYPGRELDPNLRYVPINNPPALIREGRLYAVYPIFFPLLAAPLYRLLGYAGLYVIPLASGLLTLIITYRIARLTGGEGLSSIVVLGLCSPLIFYSLVFWDHTLGTLLATLAVLLVVGSLEQPRWLPFVLAGVAIGLGIWVRSELYVMVIAMPIALLFLGTGRLRRLVALGLGILVALVPLWLFQFVVYGDFIGPHVGHLAWLSEELPATTDRVAIVYHTLLEGNSSPAMSFLYIMAFVASALLLPMRRIRTRRLPIIIAFATLVLATIPNILEAGRGRPLGGLITTAPFLVFSFAILVGSGSSVRRHNAYLLALSVEYIALVSILTPVDPGLQWGARFLLPILPPLAVLATNNFGAFSTLGGRSTSRLLTACFVCVVALSFVVQLSGLRTLHIIKSTDQQLIRDTAQLEPVQVLSDEWGYAEYVAPLFYEKQFFFVRDQTEYKELTQTLLENDIDTFAVATYPRPRRKVVDPLIAAAGYSIREVAEQVYEIQELEGTQ